MDKEIVPRFGFWETLWLVAVGRYEAEYKRRLDIEKKWREDMRLFAKALEGGYSTPSEGLAQGSALKLEDLSATMAKITFRGSIVRKTRRKWYQFRKRSTGGAF